MDSSYITEKLMPAYGLKADMIEAMKACGGYVWGSAAVRALNGGAWEPNDIDIIVADEVGAAAVEAALQACGYGPRAEVTVQDPNEFGFESEVDEDFVATIRGLWKYQRWMDCKGSVMLPMVRVRRCVKIWIGDVAAALAATDLSCCRVAMDGAGKFHGRPVAKAPVEDCDPYSRATKYRQRLAV